MTRVPEDTGPYSAFFFCPGPDFFFRLIKGDGEVIEEIVSRDRHMAINRQATRGDGDYFQTKMAGTLKK
jgi:hypothetical protein